MHSIYFKKSDFIRVLPRINFINDEIQTLKIPPPSWQFHTITNSQRTDNHHEGTLGKHCLRKREGFQHPEAGEEGEPQPDESAVGDDLIVQHTSKRTKAVRELISEVVGMIPYEKHLMDILKVFGGCVCSVS